MQKPSIPSGLSFKGNSDLGGTHDAFIFSGRNEHSYLLKDNGEDSIGRIEEAASQLGGIILGYQYIPPVWFVSTTKGTGALQPIVDNEGQPDAEPDIEFFKKYADQIAMHQVLDWAISNHDAHGRQFLYGKEGNLIAVDKGQALLHIGKDKLDYEYHPSAKLGEAPPIYNAFFKNYILGKYSVGFDRAKVAIEKLDNIEEDDYKKIMRLAVECRAKDADLDVKDLWQLVLDRKNSTRKDFETYWHRVSTEQHKMAQ